jgi:hypothetical protein
MSVTITHTQTFHRTATVTLSRTLTIPERLTELLQELRAPQLLDNASLDAWERDTLSFLSEAPNETERAAIALGRLIVSILRPAVVRLGNDYAAASRVLDMEDACVDLLRTWLSPGEDAFAYVEQIGQLCADYELECAQCDLVEVYTQTALQELVNDANRNNTHMAQTFENTKRVLRQINIQREHDVQESEGRLNALSARLEEVSSEFNARALEAARLGALLEQQQKDLAAIVHDLSQRKL